MRAARLVEVGKALRIEDLPPLQAGPGMQVVDVRCAALNRRDYWMTTGMYPGISVPATLGSDGAGVCDGAEVVINPGLAWGPDEAVQGRDFSILGMPVDGTFAEQVLVPATQIYPKPAHLTWEEAASLPLAGVTAFRALFRQGGAGPGLRILITGIGGGVALTAMLFALASHMEVTVTSGSAWKLERAKALGAVRTANYTDPAWIQDLVARNILFDLILDSAGGAHFGDLLKLVKPGGKIVVYGGTLGKIRNLSPQVLFWRQIAIQGSSMGSPADFTAMLDFVNRHQIRPVVDSVFPLAEANLAVGKLEKSDQFGKVILHISG